jgi:predicted  nucleic acid-binding Zn-ribbon protein
MATMIETDLKEVLDRIDRRLEAIESDMTTLKVSQARIEGEISTVKNELTFVREDVKDLKGSQRSQIWVLIVAVVGAIVKFGFFPNS